MVAVEGKYNPTTWILGSLLFLLLFLLGPAFSNAAPRIGETLPSIMIPDTSGRMVKVPDHFKGKVILLHFWKIGCTSCGSTMPELNEFNSKYKEKGLAIITINVGQDKKAVKTFSEKLNASYPILIDEGKKSELLYDVDDLPRTYLVDRRGVVKYRIIGEATPEILKKLILSLI